jgi:radical SAM superfamily enzyme YgiQ (UPF0313 family)
MYHAIIFTGIDMGTTSYFRALGAYRIRTELEAQGYNVKVIDYFHSLTDEHIELALEKYVSKETLWIGFSTTFFNTSALLQDRYEFFVNLRKRFDVPFVIGGAKAMVEFLDFADIFVTGYADDATTAITHYLAGKNTNLIFKDYKGKKIVDSNHSYDRKDLANIPVIWKPEDGITAQQSLPMEIARGCIFNCAFCNFPLNNKSKFDYIRVKEDMYAEFMRNYEQFGTTNYWFMDDTYNDSMVKLELMHEVITSLPFKIKFDTYIKPELLVRWPEQIDLLVESGLRGASFGVESYNKDTRKAIQKGADIDKVLDAIGSIKQKSAGQVKVQINLIVGLPHQSEENIRESRSRVVNDSNIDLWYWYPLLIHSKEHHEYHSPIDRNPEKFGYKIHHQEKLLKTTLAGKTNAWMTVWKNEHMNAIKAGRIAEDLRNMDDEYQKVAGWACGGLSSLGLDLDAFYSEHQGLRNKLPAKMLRENKTKIVDKYIQDVIK